MKRTAQVIFTGVCIVSILSGAPMRMMKAEDGVLKDGVHQSDYGALIINENISRHFVENKPPSYNPLERECRLSLSSVQSICPNEKITGSTGAWTKTGATLVGTQKTGSTR